MQGGFLWVFFLEVLGFLKTWKNHVSQQNISTPRPGFLFGTLGSCITGGVFVQIIDRKKGRTSRKKS